MDTEEEKGLVSEMDVIDQNSESESQETSLSDLIGKCINKDLDLYLKLIFIGMADAIQELQAVFINRQFYRGKLQAPTSVLLYGVPGCSHYLIVSFLTFSYCKGTGKTQLTKAVCKARGIKIINVDTSQLFSREVEKEQTLLTNILK